MKVPVMIELFHQAREAKVKLDDPLLVKNEFHSLADNSIYILDPADDSETELYKAVGQTQTLGQLCELMRRAPYQHFPAEADYKPDSYPVRDNFGIFKRAEISLIFRVSDTRQSC